MNPYVFPVLCFAFYAFFLGLLILLKRSDSIGQKYFIFSLFAAIWAAGLAMYILDNTPRDIALFFARISNGAAILISWSWLRVVFAFIGQYKKYQKVLNILGLISVLLAGTIFTELFIPDVRPILTFDNYALPGLTYHLFTVIFFTVVPVSFVFLFLYAQKCTGSEKIRAVGFILATLIGFLGGGMTFFPVYGIKLPQYGLFFLPFYPFLMAYFMIRQNLFDEVDLARAAHRDKLATMGTLSASINHEIRNPLYVIQGIAESNLVNLKEARYLEMAELSAVMAQSFEKIVSQAAKAREIMRQFTLFTKQNIAEKDEREHVAIQTLIDRVLPLVRHEFVLNEIDLEFQIPKNLPALEVNLRQIEEVFFNLFVNAVQAIKGAKQKGKIAVKASQHDGLLQIQIQDNGPGIEPGEVKHLFEPFHTTKEQGTGLGLYITKQLVEKNGGKIAVESKVGEGTTFSLVFPCGETRTP